MNIVFLGNFDVDYSSETHYLKTFKKLGHNVYPLQEGKTTAEDILSKIDNNTDLFFWVHTHGWHTENIDLVLKRCKELGIPTVGYHLDLWLGIKREMDLYTDKYWEIDYFFSVDRNMVDFLNQNENMPQAFYLPAGVFEDECYFGEFKPELANDIIFVGSRGYHAEWPYRVQLIEWLEKTYGNRFAQYGGGGRGTIRGQDLNNLYASSKIVIGDTLCKNFNYPYYLSDRIFETTGRGGFLIHPYISGMEELFKLKGETKEVVPYPYGNFEYLKYLIDYYLVNEEEREEIRKRGLYRTKRNHTYTKRLSYILDTLENLKNENNSSDNRITI